MNLHIQVMDKFILPYIKFVNTYFNEKDHYFVILNNKKLDFNHKNVKFITNKRDVIFLIKQMNEAKKIYLHGLFSYKINVLLFIQPWLLKKSSWIIWGSDLYSYRSKKRGVKSKLYEGIRKVIIRNMNEILPLVKGDYNLAREWYNTKAIYKNDAKYVNLERINYLNSLIKRKGTKKNVFISILVGNSATSTNNHREVFQLLKKFKDEDIRIYCPLSYGENLYAKEVIKVGKDIFGDKFKPIIKFMDMKLYLEFLNNVDIGIFNNDRQQGLGNITSLLYLGKKVYMRSNTTMWNEYTPYFSLFDIAFIEKENYKDFTFYDKSLKVVNQKKMIDRFDINSIVKLWEDIFKS